MWGEIPDYKLLWEWNDWKVLWTDVNVYFKDKFRNTIKKMFYRTVKSLDKIPTLVFQS